MFKENISEYILAVNASRFYYNSKKIFIDLYSSMKIWYNTVWNIWILRDLIVIMYSKRI